MVQKIMHKLIRSITKQLVKYKEDAGLTTHKN